MSRENFDQQLRKEINDLQNQIYDLQTFYLESTRDSGNLIKGFDNYLNARAPRNQVNKKPKIQNIQRLFSLTSIRSKTSQVFDETFLAQKHNDSGQIQLNKRSRIRNNMKGKGYNRDDIQSPENSNMSGDNMFSIEQSASNTNINKKKKKIHRIPNGGKGARK